MKFALLLLVALGFVALSQAAPAVEESALVAGENKEGAMNELADPHCKPGGGDGGDPEAAASSDGSKKGKRGGKGKGGKGKGKGKGKGTEKGGETDEQ